MSKEAKKAFAFLDLPMFLSILVRDHPEGFTFSSATLAEEYGYNPQKARYIIQQFSRFDCVAQSERGDYTLTPTAYEIARQVVREEKRCRELPKKLKSLRELWLLDD